MERLVFFGKGGIGKSTIASNVSAALAGLGRRVLHVGCDPKHDSTVSLLGGRMIEPVVDRIQRIAGVTTDQIVTRSHLGVDCVEAGGPGAGVGCGGRGITRMLEIFHEANLLEEGAYDVTLYDVLGDVVCGGFAAPLRREIGEKVVIVASEEVMALYAANNIAKAVVHYASNGIKLVGMVINQKDEGADRRPCERFAKLIGTEILGYVPRDPLVREAEYRRQTVVEMAPASSIARQYVELAERILAVDPATLAPPTPLSEPDFYLYTRHKFDVPPGGLGAAQPEADPGDAPVVAPGRLTAGSAEDAERRRREYTEELRAGARAVRLGLVKLDDALQRIKAAYPHEGKRLRAVDLLT